MTLATKNSYKNSSDRRKLPLSFCRNQNYGAIESIVLFGNSKFSAGLGKRWRFFKVLIIAAHFLQKVGSYYRLSVTNFYNDWSVRKTVFNPKKIGRFNFRVFWRAMEREKFDRPSNPSGSHHPHHLEFSPFHRPTRIWNWFFLGLKTALKNWPIIIKKWWHHSLAVVEGALKIWSIYRLNVNR